MDTKQEFLFPESSIFHPNRAKKLKFICVLIACGLDLSSVGATIVLVSDIEKRFGISPTQGSWALTAYVITFAGLIACFGRVGDIVGSGMMMSVFTVMFAIFSLICAVVPNFIAFAVFRALQGVAGAGIVPCAYSLVNKMFQGPNLQRYFSILSTILSGMVGVGFIIGGAFGETAIGYKEVRKLDIVGCLLFISGSFLLVVGLTEGGESWNQPAAYVPLVISILLLIAFFFWNLGYQKVLVILRPVLTSKGYKYMESVNLLMPKELMLAHNFIPVMLVTFFLFQGFMVVMYVVVNYSATVEDNSTIVASIKNIPLVVGMVLGNSAIAIKQDLFKPRNGLSVGCFIMILAGAFLIPIKYVDSNLFWKLFLLAGFLTGLGGSIYFSYMLSMAIGDAPDEYKALAGGVVQTSGQFGSEVALSIIISVLGNQSQNKANLRDRFQNASYVTIAASTIAFLISVFFVKKPLDAQNDEEQQLPQGSQASVSTTSASTSSNPENGVELCHVECQQNYEKEEKKEREGELRQ
ncbi:unnamed protein product [Kluyveromyces dobzhanskii CBS 2104]|uniref:WGS project CCBQ000000000 data, contig 00009 n=1 Tax=Kluyveromyces dobzhanskii CBS 2104 TaxID=1427455 RepID=A0A0A8L2X6_9SACH|nr:unnamed protein product [Kluyveromyces dobzhanskii CBS 2104]